MKNEGASVEKHNTVGQKSEMNNRHWEECRACLGRVDTQSAYNLFEPWITPWALQEAVIADDLSKFADVEISESDDYPKLICKKCHSRLSDACKFMITVQMSDNILRKRAKPRNPTTSQAGTSWPQPILLNKSQDMEVDKMIEVEVKQEVLSDDENGDENGADIDQDWEPVMDIKIEPEEISIPVTSNAQINGPSTKKKLRTDIVHKKCLTTYSRQDFKPSGTHSTDKSRRSPTLQIIGDIMIEYDNNPMEVDDENPTIDHVQKPREIIGVRFNEAPTTSAVHGQAFLARKSKQQQEPDAIVEIAKEDIGSAGPSEDNQFLGRSEIRTIEKTAKSAEATRRWRERKKGVSESSKKQAKTAAQRMREYRERKRAKSALAKQQWREENKGVSEKSKKQLKTAAQRMREYRERKKLKKAKSAEATQRWSEKKEGVSEPSKKQAKTTAQRIQEFREGKNSEIQRLLPLTPGAHEILSSEEMQMIYFQTVLTRKNQFKSQITKTNSLPYKYRKMILSTEDAYMPSDAMTSANVSDSPQSLCYQLDQNSPMPLTTIFSDLLHQPLQVNQNNIEDLEQRLDVQSTPVPSLVNRQAKCDDPFFSQYEPEEIACVSMVKDSNQPSPAPTTSLDNMGKIDLETMKIKEEKTEKQS